MSDFSFRMKFNYASVLSEFYAISYAKKERSYLKSPTKLSVHYSLPGEYKHSNSHLASNLKQAVVAERLRRLTRNQIPSGSVGSNPTDRELSFFLY